MREGWMRRIAERYGQSVLILREDGEITARAFFQPLPEQGETAVDTVVSLGGLDRRLWLYLGPEAVHAGELLRWNGEDFRVRRSRPYAVGETTVYWWADLERAREKV